MWQVCVGSLNTQTKVVVNKKNDGVHAWVLRVYDALQINVLPDDVGVEQTRVTLRTFNPYANDKLLRTAVREYGRSRPATEWRGMFFPPDEMEWDIYGGNAKISLDAWMDLLPDTAEVRHYVQRRLTYVLKCVVAESSIVYETLADAFRGAGFILQNGFAPVPDAPEFVIYQVSPPKRQRQETPMFGPVLPWDRGEPPRMRTAYNGDNWTTKEAIIQSDTKRRARSRAYVDDDEAEQRRPEQPRPGAWALFGGPPRVEDAEDEMPLPAFATILDYARMHAGGPLVPHVTENDLREYALRYGRVGPRSTQADKDAFRQMVRDADADDLLALLGFIDVGTAALSVATVGAPPSVATVGAPSPANIPDFGMIVATASAYAGPAMIQYPPPPVEVAAFAARHGAVGAHSSPADQGAFRRMLETGDVDLALGYLNLGIEALAAVTGLY